MKQYSIDEASKSQGGLLPAVSEGQQEKAFDTAIFAADRGKIEGPVKTQFGWYVFEVEKVTKASQQTLEQSKDTIKNLLRSQRQQKALDEFVKDFREDYKDETELRGRLPRGRVQERSEGRVRHRSRLRRQPGRAAAAGSSRSSPPPAPDNPAPAPSGGADLSAALERLDEITRRLRLECPWDREQDERSIVPHTVEEAYELADAAHSGDDAKLLDELGDVLFQVYFLRCCSRSAGRAPRRGGRALPPEADPAPPARVRRPRGRDGRRRRAQLEPDQARRRARRRDLRRHPGDAALDSLREEGAEAGGRRRP